MPTCMRWALAAVVSCLALLLVGSSALTKAEDKMSPREVEARKRNEERADCVRSLALAWALAEEGRRSRSPLQMLAASEVLRRLRLAPRVVGDAPQIEREKDVPAAPFERGPEWMYPSEEADLLLSEAMSLTRRLFRDGALSELEVSALDRVAESIKRLKAVRGAIGGPQVRHGKVRVGETHVYPIAYDGVGPACVHVLGDGRSLIQLTVRTNRGVVAAADAGANPAAEWAPPSPAGGVYNVRVQNRGTEPAAYRLLTN